MRKIFEKVLILIVILNFMGMIIQCTITNKNKTKTTIINNSMETNRLQEIKEKGVITIAASSNDFPFFYINTETNKMVGIDADIITEIAKRLEISKVEMKETQFSNLLEKLNTDDSIDMAAGGIYITPEREKLVEFTQPLYKESEIVVVPRFSNINFMNDLKNALVGVEKGTVFVDLAQKWKDNNLIKDIVIFENASNLLGAVNNKKIDAALDDSVAVNNILSKDKNLILRTLKDYTPELPGIIGIAVKKNDISLLKALNEKIDEMKADGTLYAILKKYGLDKNNIVEN